MLNTNPSTLALALPKSRLASTVIARVLRPSECTIRTPSMTGAKIMTSGIDRTTGASKITRSKPAFQLSIRRFSRVMFNNSVGFKGLEPAKRSLRLSIDVSCTTLCHSNPCTSTSVKPWLLMPPKSLWSDECRKSVSTSNTRRPSCAKETARFAAVVDLPSWGAALVTRSVCTRGVVS